LIMGGGRRMDSLECFHSHRLRARGAREPCFEHRTAVCKRNGPHELAVCDIPLATTPPGTTRGSPLD
jgi:hypothetical protein